MVDATADFRTTYVTKSSASASAILTFSVMNTAGPKSAGKCNRRFVKHAEGSMRFTTTAESTIRALIAGVDEQRLRALIVELALAVLRCLVASESSELAAPTGNGGFA
jgi:hypothetical protein